MAFPSFSWATKDDIPYIRVVRFIPKAMKDKLPAYYLSALDTQVRPTLRTLA